MMSNGLEVLKLTAKMCEQVKNLKFSFSTVKQMQYQYPVK